MQVAVRIDDGLTRTLTITIPHQDVEGEIEKELKEFAKQARIQGFRPGKVPLSFVRKRFGQSIRDQEVGKLMEKHIETAFEQEKLDVATIISVEKMVDKPGVNLEYKAEVELYPEIHFHDLSNVSITQYTVDITDADVEEMLQRLCKQRGVWVDVDRPAKDEDQVTIDFEGKIADQPFTGNSGKDVKIVLGAKSMLPGFEEGIRNHKASETFLINLDFPKDYPSAEVAGKQAQFSITLNKVEEKKAAELNDAFAKEMGYEEGGVEALRKAMRDDMQKTLNKSIFQKIKKEIIEKLNQTNKVDIPKRLLDRAISNQREQITRQNGIADFSETYLEKLREETVDTLAFDLLVRHYVKQHQIQLEEHRFREKLLEVVANSPFAKEMLQYIAKDPRRRAEIEQMALEEQVIEKLLETSKRNEKKISYQEAIGLTD